MDYRRSYSESMPQKRVLDDKSCLDGQDSDESDKLKITDNHLDENYSSNCNQCNRKKDDENEGKMKIAVTLKGDNTPDYAVDNHNLSCPSSPIRGSHHKARKLGIENNCSIALSDFRNVETESVPLANIGVVNVYQCKYCSEEDNDSESLIVPCRCSGSLEHVHRDCLKNWIRVHYGTSDTEPRCELCKYRFCRRKHYKWTHCSCPELSRSDRWRYSLGFMCTFVAMCCLLALILCFGQNNPFTKHYANNKVDKPVIMSVNAINRVEETYRLSTQDNVKIVCGVLFIICSALCVYLGKSCNIPPHKFIFTCIQSGKQWTILPYSASRDSLVTGKNATNV
ncbi:hypothetical protein ACJMK2_042245 [Sinanodonta woodiana]|uniref:RING-CH-type domain-containing protein n=1 Tax=Sinanodonta woodiana TaxID=1069815 RepID=A0ABD3W6S7_SINWO